MITISGLRIRLNQRNERNLIIIHGCREHITYFAEIFLEIVGLAFKVKYSAGEGDFHNIIYLSTLFSWITNITLLTLITL